MNVSYDEFKKTVYHTRLHIVVPLLNIRLDKSEFIKKDKYQPNLVEIKLMELYHDNIKRFE